MHIIILNYKLLIHRFNTNNFVLNIIYFLQWIEETNSKITFTKY